MGDLTLGGPDALVKASSGPVAARSRPPAHLPLHPAPGGIIKSEDSLLEVQMGARPDWLLVCHEGRSPALGLRICRVLGHLRLTHHEGMNVSDIKCNRSRELAWLSTQLGGLLEAVSLPR
ncbi:hypothetical protein MC885_017904 [Smutsia gigantea]|nr:hypothetical protein MC885_017904 [Smutsia gigantea]